MSTTPNTPKDNTISTLASWFLAHYPIAQDMWTLKIQTLTQDLEDYADRYGVAAMAPALRLAANQEKMPPSWAMLREYLEGERVRQQGATEAERVPDANNALPNPDKPMDDKELVQAKKQWRRIQGLDIDALVKSKTDTEPPF